MSIKLYTSKKGQVNLRGLCKNFALYLVWENSRGTSVEIPYWWRVTTQIWVGLLIGSSKFSTNLKHYLDQGSD